MDAQYDSYFDWLIRQIETERYNRNNYFKVLVELYSTEFYYILDRDENRSTDGLSLRDRFVKSTGLYPYFYLGEKPSVLEVLIALANRVQEDLFYNENIAPEFFWIMIENLGLTRLSDDVFSEKICKNTIKRFLNREYYPDGKGNIFYSKLATFDFRNIEIWYQMATFVDEFLTDF